MKKQSIALALVLALAVSLFAGCSGNNQTSATEPNAQSGVQNGTVQDPTDNAEEIVNISVVVVGTDNQPAQKQVIDACNAYSAEKIGVTISFAGYGWGEYNDTVSRMLASKDDIDVVFSQGNLTWCNGGALKDLTDILPQYPNLTSIMPQSIWDSVKVNDKIYFVPNYKETGTGLSIATPIAIADKVKAEYGIDFNEIEMNSIFDIKNLEPYLLACQKLGVAYSFGTGISDYFWLNNCDPKYEVVGSIPFVANKETGVVSTYYELPEYQEFNALMQDWNKKGIWREEQAMSDFDETAVCKSGDWAIMGWINVPGNEATIEARHGHPVYVKTVTPNLVQSSSAMGSDWSLTAYTEKTDACMKWLELLNTDKTYADLFVYGVEGVQYTREADGRITKIADSGWANDVWKSTNTWNASIQSNESPNKYEEYTEFNAIATNSPLLGFRADVSNVNTEMAAIQAIYNESRILLARGFYDEEDLEDIITRCKGAGSDKVCAEIQAQLDSFLGK